LATAKRSFIPNQVFIGLPWKTVRPKYDRIIAKLEKTYPIYFTIVGRNDGQDALDLFEIIKTRIENSSYAIFDATGGNANVSLEYGYAEGIGVQKAIFLSSHKATQKSSASSPIISDLHGQRRVQYKTEKALLAEIQRLCREHDFTRRFEKAMPKVLAGKAAGAKKSARTLALKIVRALDGKPQIRRAELVQHLQAQGYVETEIESMLKKLHNAGLVKCTVGRSAVVYVA
jgi:hypothetical protein